MAIVKYIKETYIDRAGHTNELLAITGVHLVRSAKQMMFNVETARFKDYASLVSGKLPCPDKCKPELLYSNNISLTPLEVYNAIVTAIALKNNLTVMDKEEEIVQTSPQAQIEAQNV